MLFLFSNKLRSCRCRFTDVIQE